MHRADLHAGLLEAATRAGVQILNDKRVVEYNFEGPFVVTADGETWRADLVIGADGMYAKFPDVCKH